MNKTRPCKEEVIENKYNVNGLTGVLHPLYASLHFVIVQKNH